VNAKSGYKCRRSTYGRREKNKEDCYRMTQPEGNVSGGK
jgi:hypothetical protein